MISCIIIEDQAPAQRILQRYINDYGNIELKGVFTDAIQALEYLKSNKVDFMFLDVHLPKLSGIDFLDVLTEKPLVILTTAFSDYALKGYELEIVDYLLKPFSFDRFVKAVVKANKHLGLNSNIQSDKSEADTILIKSGYNHIKLIIDDILYIKSDGDYTILYTSEKSYIVTYSLRHWEQNLPDDKFCRVHRSYMVNIPAIEEVSGSIIVINDTDIPIGRKYKEDFRRLFTR